MKSTYRELAIVSVSSGALAIGAYILLRRFLKKTSRSSSIFRHASRHISMTMDEYDDDFEDEKELINQSMVLHYADDLKELILFDLYEKTDITKCFSFPKKITLLCKHNCRDLFLSENVK